MIAYQADYLGTAEVTRPGDPATVAITSSKMEISVGDRLEAEGREDFEGSGVYYAATAREAKLCSDATVSGPSRIASRSSGR